jgi:hypothetical protein
MTKNTCGRRQPCQPLAERVDRRVRHHFAIVRRWSCPTPGALSVCSHRLPRPELLGAEQHWYQNTPTRGKGGPEPVSPRLKGRPASEALKQTPAINSPAHAPNEKQKINHSITMAVTGSLTRYPFVIHGNTTRPMCASYMARIAQLNLRVRPRLKATLIKLAKQDRTTLSVYGEKLLENHVTELKLR